MTTKPSLNYALIGSSGYIAPRHFRAINNTQGTLNSIIDIDFSKESLKLFPKNITKFTSLEEFLEQDSQCDFVVICSPNFLHEEHIELSLKAGKNIICEKPVALSQAGLDRLKNIEENSDGRVNTILQLRLHPVIQKLKKNIKTKSSNKIKLIYVARRDDNYFKSWKGNDSLSGGMITNVGIHYLDLVTYLFGKVIDLDIKQNTFNRSSGTLTLEKGTLQWLFSFHPEEVEQFIEANESSHRSFLIDNENIDFSNVSEDLHTSCYKEIINDRGFSLDDARPSIALIDKIMNKE